MLQWSRINDKKQSVFVANSAADELVPTAMDERIDSDDVLKPIVSETDGISFPSFLKVIGCMFLFG